MMEAAAIGASTTDPQANAATNEASATVAVASTDDASDPQPPHGDQANNDQGNRHQEEPNQD